MRELLKIFFILATFFLTTFLLIKYTGILSIEQIENWLYQAKEISPIYMGMIIVALLFADLFIAVSTLTIILFAGYFLGFIYGAMFSIIGVTFAGVVGYLLSRYYGDKILEFLLKDAHKKDNAIKTFHKHGFTMILLSRAMPMIPEISACLSGMTKMHFGKFILAWGISSVPYVLIASYAGSISSLENPKPAIFAAVGISLFFWISWFFVTTQPIKYPKLRLFGSGALAPPIFK